MVVLCVECSEFPEFQVLINQSKPRKGSFELIFQDEKGQEQLLWTGIEKGPPKKLKFPDHEELMPLIKKQIEKQ
jgi:selT/selW/selH-like putative selenoprotein